MPPAEATQTIIAQQITGDSFAGDLRIGELLEVIKQRHGAAVQAVLLYGSYVRGKRDTVLDFYVLLDSYRNTLPHAWHGWANRLLPPNVYQIQAQSEGETARAKYATVRVDHFVSAVSRDFHSYFWARFAQPCVLVYARTPEARARVGAALLNATRTFIARTLPMIPDEFDAQTLWSRGFALTYSCELRSEKSAYAEALYTSYGPYLSELTDALAGESGLGFERADVGRYRSFISPTQRLRSRFTWGLRRWQGKALSVARLLKAAATFNDPVDYVLWKIARHSGVRVEDTERQRRHPLIFGWGLLWRVYRRGGFR